jgi:hypothetical protein
LLTKVLKAEWEQGKELSWKLQHHGDRIQLLIRDPAVSNTYVLPSQRSSGFSAFFVLTLTLFARTWQNPRGSFIYLFDEPGTYLHPVAQINLQRVFESIADSRQLIYTTHSLFLVNKNEPLRNRVVQKGENGTQIDKKPFAKNWKSVRESLGIIFSNNFFISDRTLLVEGPSDPIYLLCAILHLIRHANIDIDLNAFSIADGGTETNYCAMAKLMLAEGRRVHALLDGDEHGAKTKKKLEQLAPTELLEGSLQITLLPAGMSVEDLMPHKALLSGAACDAVADLIAHGACAFAAGESAGKLRTATNAECAKVNQTETLGRRLIACVADRLDNKLELSKVNIAARYEDSLRNLEGAVPEKPPALLAVVESLRKQLELGSRKSAAQVLEK